ncbi:MAG: DUF2087 domain-containing protein [Treponema sp.]|nr:DUF2087 domain-containing protein [Treponema sp.]
MTESEINIILKSIRDDEGIIIRWPKKKEEKLAVLEYLITKFEEDKKYKELEVNMILKRWNSFGDHALLRRELYDNFLLDRSPDGSWYEVHKK